MTPDLWKNAVEITLDCGDHFKTVRNSRDALACLMTTWPARRSKAFASARKACLGAINGTIDEAVAAAAFKKAAIEAGVLRH